MITLDGLGIVANNAHHVKTSGDGECAELNVGFGRVDIELHQGVVDWFETRAETKTSEHCLNVFFSFLLQLNEH